MSTEIVPSGKAHYVFTMTRWSTRRTSFYFASHLWSRGWGGAPTDRIQALEFQTGEGRTPAGDVGGKYPCLLSVLSMHYCGNFDLVWNIRVFSVHSVDS